MTCAEVRDSLSEQALGLLPGEEAREIERHLQWCAGCRKEGEELLEGASRVAFSIPPAEPPLDLEDRVVEKVLMASGKVGTRRSRRGIRVLAVAALTAAFVAGSALQWGLAQRHQVQRQQTLAEQTQQKLDRMQALLGFVQNQLKAPSGQIYQASLFPGPGKEPAGAALLYAAPRGAGFALVDVIAPLDTRDAPFSVNLVSSNGRRLELGVLSLTNNGDYLLFRPDLPKDLSRSDSVELSQVTSLEILDRSGTPVATGTVHPGVVETAPSP
jgi:hypothetical protein